MKESTFFHRYKEILLGVFMVALAAFYLYHATLIRTRSTVSVSAKMIPEILGCLVILLGALQIHQGVKHLLAVRRQDAENGVRETFFASGEIKDAIPVILTFIIILFYAIAFEPLGFVVSSTICIFSLMWVLTPKEKFRPLRFAGICLVVTLLIYIAFRKGLDLSLPEGVLEGFPLL